MHAANREGSFNKGITLLILTVGTMCINATILAFKIYFIDLITVRDNNIILPGRIHYMGIFFSKGCCPDSYLPCIVYCNYCLRYWLELFKL